MARPAKKPPEQWENEILDAAQNLFLSKGYEKPQFPILCRQPAGQQECSIAAIKARRNF